MEREWGRWDYGSPNSHGNAILFEKGVDCNIHSKILDPAGLYVTLKAEIKCIYWLIFMHKIPILSSLKDLGTILQKENLDAEENIILGGDFNCPINPVLDKTGSKLLSRKSIVENHRLFMWWPRPCWYLESEKSFTKSHTWSQKSPLILCRLNYWLILNHLQDLATTTDIIPAIKTDHAAISIEFSISEKHIKGPGHWNVNCSR